VGYNDLIFLNLFRSYTDKFAKAGRHDFMVYLEEMVKAGEYGIALEDFLVQMYEYDLKIFSSDLDIVRKLCENMGIDSNLWLVLSTKIPSDKAKFLC
jgi:hypothetical protein